MTTLQDLTFGIDDLYVSLEEVEAVNTPKITHPRAWGYVDALGVTGRMVDVTGDYGSVTDVMACMAALGVKHMRTAAPIPNGQGRTAIQTMAAAGYTFTFTIRVFTTSGHETAGRTIVDQVGWIDGLEASYPGSVTAVEGPNEVDNPNQVLPNLDYTDWQDFQDAVVAAVAASTHLSGKPVLGFSGAPWTDSAGTTANIHHYPRNGDQFGAKGDSFVAYGRGVGKFMQVTEAGFGNSTTSTPYAGTDDTTQAKLILNLACEGPSCGLERTFIYQLLDPFAPTTSMESWFGLFSHPFTIKPAGTALGRFISLIRDDATNAKTHTNLPVRVSSTETNFRWTSFARADGSTVVLLWRNVDIWNQSTKLPISITPITVPLTIDKASPTSALYDPASSSTAIATSTSESISVDLGDTPLVLIIS